MAGIGRVVFLGTGAFAVPLLSRLPALADDIVVVTQPDRPAGRRLRLRATPVATWARDHGLRVETPTRIGSDEAASLVARFRPDGLLLASYGQLVPTPILEAAPRQPLNVHPSLLPRHRGAAPVAGTLLAGDAEAGVTLMVMTGELDAGPIVAQWRIRLLGRETAPELEAQLAELAAREVPPRLEEWARGRLEATPQPEREATHVRPFRRRDGWVDWRAPAVDIDRQVRALQPWPGAWTTLDGRRLHIRRAHAGPEIGHVPIGAVMPGEQPAVACGVGALTLEIVQPEGRPAMTAADWRRGLPRDHVILGASPPAGVEAVSRRS